MAEERDARMIMRANVRVNWFYSDEDFIRFVEKIGAKINVPMLIEHERRHSKKARDLGYKVIYGVEIATNRKYRINEILICYVTPLGEFLLTDLIEIASAQEILAIAIELLLSCAEAKLR